MSIKLPAMRDVFLEKVWRQMSHDDSIFFVSADFGSPVLDKVRRDFPDRFINVGIAEQNLINISAGLASEGFNVYAYAIAPFITMRCYEQIRVNASLLSEVRDLSINLIGVGVGYSYVVSGPTHQCYEDLTLMRSLPNFEIISPSDHVTAEHSFKYSMKRGLRYFRFDAQALPVVYKSNELNNLGFSILKRGKEALLITTGFVTHTALKVVHELKNKGVILGVVDIYNITHFSKNDLLSEIKKYQFVVSCEEGFAGRGGLDAMIGELLRNNNVDIKFMGLGINPRYSFELGSREFLHERAGIGKKSIIQSIEKFIDT